MTQEIKTAIKRKHMVYKKFNSRGTNPGDWNKIRILRNETIHLVDTAKDNWYQSLPVNNTILNKNKVTCILPLLEGYVFVTSFQMEAVIFNEYFVQQYFLINNSSQLLAFLTKISSILENS